jgi:hypothetical protein
MWSSKVYDSFREYIQGKMASSTTGFGVEVTPVVSAEMSADDKIENSKTSDDLMGASFPSLFSRSWSDSKDVDKMADFFVKERGSVALSEAICLTQKIDIADRYRSRVYAKHFRLSVILLQGRRRPLSSPSLTA